MKSEAETACFFLSVLGVFCAKLFFYIHFVFPTCDSALFALSSTCNY